MIYLDYIVPVADIRRKVEEIAAASPLWDRRLVNVQVTDFKDASMEIRILVSATTSGRTFDPRCEMREKRITYLQKAYPHALPRQRMEIASQGAELQQALIDTEAPQPESKVRLTAGDGDLHAGNVIREGAG